MSIFGWVSLFILFFLMILLTIRIPKQMPVSDAGKRIIALSPLLLAILFVLIAPSQLFDENNALSDFIKIIIPFAGMAFSLPLILKAKKEIEKG